MRRERTVPDPPGVEGRRVDPRHDERTAARLGIALGVGFAVCLVTGVYSHLLQHPVSWLPVAAAPAGTYRVTQGLHVLTGIACVPLLLAKLWSVYPKLLTWPPVRSLAHAVERISLVPLVGGALFQLWTGIANIDLWYPLPFFFPAGHWYVAWITVGALVVHVGAKMATTREALARAPEPPSVTGERRRFLGLIGAGSALLVGATAGMTVRPLERLALLSPRLPSVGPQGLPVNKTAAEAGVVDAASAVDYRLAVGGAVRRPLALTLADLEAMPQHEAVLPIACVEGWSASARWRGVRLGDLLDAAGADADARVTVHSLEDGLYGSSEVTASQARAEDLLLALRLDDEPLDLDHGFPVRLIGPNRPGVAQTKWLARVEVR